MMKIVRVEVSATLTAFSPLRLARAVQRRYPHGFEGTGRRADRRAELASVTSPGPVGNRRRRSAPLACGGVGGRRAARRVPPEIGLEDREAGDVACAGERRAEVGNRRPAF